MGEGSSAQLCKKPPAELLGRAVDGNTSGVGQNLSVVVNLKLIGSFSA